MPFDQTQVRDYAVVIHAGNDEWTWQVMDFDARVAAQERGAGSRERLAQRHVRGRGRGRVRPDRSPGLGFAQKPSFAQKKGRLPQEEDGRKSHRRKRPEGL